MSYEVRQISDCDHLSECYLAAYQWIEQMHREHPDATILVDYTGGTKSMTAGLAAAFPDDPLGQHFHGLRNRLLNFSTVRNASLFAHGSRPITPSDYREHAGFVDDFIRTAIALAAAAQSGKRRSPLEQFPTEFGDE